MLKLVDHIGLHTDVELIFTKDGKIIGRKRLGENIVVAQGRSNMAHLLAGDDVSNRKVFEVRLGDAGHNPSDPTQPLPVLTSDSDLFGSLVITKPVSTDYPDGANANKVRFTATVSESEGNGSGYQAISEYGLYDATGRMMTHKTSGLITKSNAFGITIRWTIIF